jgi:hypothetical protein
MSDLPEMPGNVVVLRPKAQDDDWETIITCKELGDHSVSRESDGRWRADHMCWWGDSACTIGAGLPGRREAIRAALEFALNNLRMTPPRRPAV